MSDTQQLGSEGVSLHQSSDPLVRTAGNERPSLRVSVGQILAGKYRLEHEVGRGGMGSVWQAERLGWNAAVAVKVMTHSGVLKPGAVKRFEREARLAATLRSPHVVQLLDHGVDSETGIPFMVMELLEGESLATRLRERGPLSPAETRDVVVQLSRALTRAHAQGIVHRDLKPDNVFLVSNAEEIVVKILDFGVGKWIAPAVAESFETRPGSLVGSPFYMSPEQIRSASTTDHRADLWSLAVMITECLTGCRPFAAPDFAALAVLLCGSAPRPIPSTFGAVPAGFDNWFRTATARKIQHRFQSAQSLTAALRPLCQPSPVLDKPADSLRPVVAERSEGQFNRWNWRRLAPAIALGTAIGATAFVTLFNSENALPVRVAPASPERAASSSVRVGRPENPPQSRKKILPKPPQFSHSGTKPPPLVHPVTTARLTPPISSKASLKKRTAFGGEKTTNQPSARRRSRRSIRAKKNPAVNFTPVVNGHAIRTQLKVTTP